MVVDASVSFGRCFIAADELIIGPGAVIADGAALVGARIEIGADVEIRRDADIRASQIEIAEGCIIGDRTRVLVAGLFRVGERSMMLHDVDIRCSQFTAERDMYMGERFCVGYGTTMESQSLVTIGVHVLLGADCILNPNYPITIGDRTAISPQSSLWTHGYHTAFSVLDGFNSRFGPVIISKDCWLGFKTSVLAGVTVGEGTIVATASVVTKDIPARVFVGGAPATVKRELNPIPAADPAAVVREIIDDWGATLPWKGLTLDEGGSDRWVVRGPDADVCVTLCATASAAVVAAAHSSASVVVWTGTETPPTLECVVFDVQRRSYTGSAASPVVQDLRNFMRRATIDLEGPDRYSSLENPVVSKLRNVSWSGQ